MDIRIENLKLAFEGEIKVGNRVVDYFNDTLEMAGPVKFTSPPPLYNDWPFVPIWKPTDNYSQPDSGRVIHDNKFWGLNLPAGAILPGNSSNTKPDAGPPWIKLPWDLRKVEISWQANDPLVN